MRSTTFTLTATVAMLASGVAALQVTEPSTSSIWQTNGGAQTVSWSSVNTDPSEFEIVLVNQSPSYHLNNPIVLEQSQSTSAGSTTVSPPSGSWPEGTGYQINLINSTTNAILAQSGTFNVTSGGSASSSASSSSSSMSMSSSKSSSMMMTTSTMSAMSTGSATSGSASTSEVSGIPTSTGKSGAIAGLNVPTGALTVAAGSLIAGLTYFLA